MLQNLDFVVRIKQEGAAQLDKLQQKLKQVNREAAFNAVQASRAGRGGGGMPGGGGLGGAAGAIGSVRGLQQFNQFAQIARGGGLIAGATIFAEASNTAIKAVREWDDKVGSVANATKKDWADAGISLMNYLRPLRAINELVTTLKVEISGFGDELRKIKREEEAVKRQVELFDKMAENVRKTRKEAESLSSQISKDIRSENMSRLFGAIDPASRQVIEAQEVDRGRREQIARLRELAGAAYRQGAAPAAASIQAEADRLDKARRDSFESTIADIQVNFENVAAGVVEDAQKRAAEAAAESAGAFRGAFMSQNQIEILRIQEETAEQIKQLNQGLKDFERRTIDRGLQNNPRIQQTLADARGQLNEQITALNQSAQQRIAIIAAQAAQNLILPFFGGSPVGTFAASPASPQSLALSGRSVDSSVASGYASAFNLRAETESPRQRKMQDDVRRIADAVANVRGLPAVRFN